MPICSVMETLSQVDTKSTMQLTNVSTNTSYTTKHLRLSVLNNQY